jgi:hypothetical protein
MSPYGLVSKISDAGVGGLSGSRLAGAPARYTGTR